jgi:starch synthase (maltosyl-transferring)
VQTGWVDLDVDAVGLAHDETYAVEDLLNDARWTWRGARNWIALDPAVTPAHVFRVRRGDGIA